MARDFAGKSFIDNDGNVVTANNAKESERYSLMGFRTAQVGDIRREEIRKVYDNWYGAAATFGNGVLDAIPFAQTAITSGVNALQGDEAAREYAEQHDTMKQVNPISSVAGNLAGSGALLGMMPGLPGVTTTTTLGAVAEGAAVNVALGAANAVDRAALAHAIQPGGEEKVFAHLAGDLLFDGLVGAGFAGLGSAFKAAGNWTENFANKQFRQSLVDAKTYAQYVQQGRATEFGATLDRYAVWGDAPAAVQAKIAPEIENLGQAFNVMKERMSGIRMPPAQAGQIADEMGNILAESHPEVAKELTQDILATGNAPNLGELHAMRQKLDSKINFGTQTDAEFAMQQPLFRARETMSQRIQQYLRQADPVGNGAAAEQWAQLDKDYSNLMLLSGGLRKASTATGEKLPWTVTLLAHTIGFSGAGKLFMAYKGAKKMGAMLDAGVFAQPAKVLAGVFDGTAEKLTQATEAGLMGAAAETTAILHADAHTEKDYDLLAAQINHAQGDTIKTGGNLMKLATQANLPDELATMVTMKTLQANDYLSQQLPRNPMPQFNAGMPSQFRPSREMRQKWVGIYNSIKDPTYALLNPTVDNMRAMQQFYPQLLENAQDAIVGQFRDNPRMPLQAQMWASQVMGYPVGSLTQPMFYMMLGAARQAEQAQAQMAAQQAGGKPAQAGVDSQGTKMDSLRQRGR